MDKAVHFLDGWTTLRNWTYEIIVVDDGSTDSTTSVAKDYFKRHQNVFRVITLMHNQGKGGAIKVGVQEALGKYILMVRL
jgi:dolichyl-phosphate beta-glucosyltransferase